jgi:hypothetical protein
MPGEDTGRILWSCVLDDTPAIWDSFRVWLATLIHCAGVSPADVVVHHVTPLRDDIAALIAGAGVRSRAVARFDIRSPHSNKIRQCATDYGPARRVVLTDVDIAFLRRPPVDGLHAPVAGKLVDRPNPPLEVLARIFDASGLPAPRTSVTAAFFDGTGAAHAFETFPGNFNGGFYAIETAVIAALGAAWERQTRWLLDQGLLPTLHALHVDQVGFCLALAELGIEPQLLPGDWNLPSHMPTDPSDAAPFVVHHHGHLEPDLRLKPLRPARHEHELRRANTVIAAFAGAQDRPRPPR